MGHSPSTVANAGPARQMPCNDTTPECRVLGGALAQKAGLVERVL